MLDITNKINYYIKTYMRWRNVIDALRWANNNPTTELR